VYEAKTTLPRLLEDVEHGETVTITRHGKPVARLVPIRRPRRSTADVIEDILELRKGNRLDGLTIRELIDEGRR
jgi:prevent-host-death family protein